MEATVKQTPIGDKYFINETLREPKTENISQVIMVGSPFVLKINQLLLIKILRSPKARPASQFKEITRNGKLERPEKGQGTQQNWRESWKRSKARIRR